MEIPRVQYARSGDIHVAYQTMGAGGGVDIVLGLPYVSHLGVYLELPSVVEFYQNLAALGRLVVFDKRGVGLSDRMVQMPTLEERMDDIRAVMDAVGSKKAVLVGISESAPMSMLFAATHPERTSGLIIIGGYAKSIRAPDYPWRENEEEYLAWLSEIERRWGTREFASEFAASVAPSAKDKAATEKWFDRLFSFGASPGSAVALERMNKMIDVRSSLPAIHVPTLVIAEATDSARGTGQYIASHVEGARLLELPDLSHFFLVSEEATGTILSAIRAFVDELPGVPETNRFLTTVMFTDIVGSTAKVAEMGDRAWSGLLGKFMDGAKTELARFGGRLVKTTGDGLLATFDGPTRAIRCACELRERAHSLGLNVRTGLHSGECVFKDRDVQGIAVHIASRVGAAAGDGEVVVSRTVKDLSMGADLIFRERDPQTLKGLEGEWQTYSVLNA